MRNLILFCLFCLSLRVGAQSVPPATEFGMPLSNKMLLSGTFGEIRGTHFHAGLDIKTEEKIGKEVKVVESGYISRIRITHYGYGKAIYVNHPSGYTTVYAHLDHFNKHIEKYVRDIQYKKRSYVVDISVPKDELFYHKGDIIAYSGNTGMSMGPHLHFEVRKTSGQIPLNPMSFGYAVFDNIPPTINSLKVYNHNIGDTLFPVKSNANKYRLLSVDTLLIADKVSFGIEAFDRLNGAINKNGVYSVELFKDEELVFHLDFNRVPFEEAQYVKALIDYGEYIDSKKTLIKTVKLPGNKLSLYKTLKNNGNYSTQMGEVCNWKYQIKDFSGNKSTLSFVTKTAFPSKKMDKSKFLGHPVQCQEATGLYFDSLKVDIPANCLYENYGVVIERVEIDSGLLSYRIGDVKVPLFRSFSFSSDVMPYSKSLLKKMVWANYCPKKNTYKAITTTVKGGRPTGVVNSFGTYALLVDTVSPTISFINRTAVKNGKQKIIKITIKDELSGINKYELFLNDKWVLAEYDAKNNLLCYTFDHHVVKGKNSVLCRVEDMAGNVKEQSFTFDTEKAANEQKKKTGTKKK